MIALKRLKFADEDPIAIVESYLPYEFCQFILEQIWSGSPFTILSPNGRTPR